MWMWNPNLHFTYDAGIPKQKITITEFQIDQIIWGLRISNRNLFSRKTFIKQGAWRTVGKNSTCWRGAHTTACKMNREKSSTLSKKGQSPGSQDDSAPGHKIMKQSKREHKMSMAESFFFIIENVMKNQDIMKKEFFLKNQQNLWKQNIRNSW